MYECNLVESGFYYSILSTVCFHLLLKKAEIQGLRRGSKKRDQCWNFLTIYGG